MTDVQEQNDKSPEQIPYFGSHELPEDLDPKVNGPFRNDEEESFRDARRKGNALEWLREQAKKELARREADDKANAYAGSPEAVKAANKAAEKKKAADEKKAADDSAKADGKK